MHTRSDDRPQSRRRPRPLLLLLILAIWAPLLVNVFSLIETAADPVWSVPRTTDALEAVTAIAGNHVHGWSDDHLTTERMSRTALHRPVRATCGSVSAWSVELLRSAG